MIYLELFYVFFLVGLFTFGGGYAMISILETEIISRGWLDRTTFFNVVSIRFNRCTTAHFLWWIQYW